MAINTSSIGKAWMITFMDPKSQRINTKHPVPKSSCPTSQVMQEAVYHGATHRSTSTEKSRIKISRGGDKLVLPQKERQAPDFCCLLPYFRFYFCYAEPNRVSQRFCLTWSTRSGERGLVSISYSNISYILSRGAGCPNALSNNRSAF